MAITVRRDLINGHEYEEDDKTGMLTRLYRVDGLPSVSNITDLSLAAVDSIDPSIHVPGPGEGHETMPDMRVRRVRPVPVAGSRTAMKIYVSYIKLRRRLLSVDVGGASERVLTNRDINGKIMFVGYIPPNKAKGASISASTPFPNPRGDGNDGDYKFNYISVPTILPNAILSIQYLENICPLSKWALYGRRVNSKSWQGFDARTWFCEYIGGPAESPIPLNPDTAVDGDGVVTGDADFNWEVTYQFRYSPQPSKLFDKIVDGPGWDPLSIFVDQQTGRTPNDVDPVGGGWPDKAAGDDGTVRGNGWATHTVLHEADFNDLNLVTIN